MVGNIEVRYSFKHLQTQLDKLSNDLETKWSETLRWDILIDIYNSAWVIGWLVCSYFGVKIWDLVRTILWYGNWWVSMSYYELSYNTWIVNCVVTYVLWINKYDGVWNVFCRFYLQSKQWWPNLYGQLIIIYNQQSSKWNFGHVKKDFLIFTWSNLTGPSIRK